MSNSHLEKYGGASITPSARPSIHRHKDCPCFGDYYTTMGTHGLKSRPSKNRNGSYEAGTSSNTAPGIDEVDNVLSKFRCPTPDNHNGTNFYNKRHSFVSPEQSDDSCNSILAKSLPTYLPSYSNCSEEFDYMEEPCEKQQEHSFSSYKSTQSHNRSRSVIKESVSPNRSPDHYNRRDISEIKSPQQSYPILILLLAVILGFAFYLMEPLGVAQNIFNVSNAYDQSKFYNDLNDVGKRYGISEDAILRVQSGISVIFEKQDAGSFIFIYNSELTEFDQTEFNQLIHDVANIAAKYLRNDSTSVQHAMIDTSSFDMQSHSEFMKKYREEVAKTGVMVVRELHKVPSVLAMAFHYYCDEYNPLVKKSAIFFTLDIANCSSYLGKKQPLEHSLMEFAWIFATPLLPSLTMPLEQNVLTKYILKNKLVNHVIRYNIN